MVDKWDPVYTDIMISRSYSVNPNDVCRCDDYFYSSYGSDCECPTDPRVKWMGCRVRIPQKPIRTEPIDTTYVVQIYNVDTYKSDVNNRDLFCSENLIAEFSVSDSISHESNETYVEYLKNYTRNTYQLDLRVYDFKGCKSMAEYIKSFYSITQRMINNFDSNKKDPENTDNPHIKRRQKMKVYTNSETKRQRREREKKERQKERLERRIK